MAVFIRKEFLKPLLQNQCYMKVGISRTTLSLKHVKRKRKNEHGKF